MWGIVSILALIILSPLLLIIFLMACWLIYRIIKGDRLPPLPKKKKKRSMLQRLFIDLPRAYVDDMFNRDPDRFPDYGLHLICGEQGSGKTITLAYILNQYKKEYPKAKIRSNFFYKNQDDEINHWQDLVFSDNGIYGQIEVLDEIQNWFSSNQSKDFPIEMIQEITQQRKQSKVIYGTAQVFNRVAKPIREQVNYLYQPMTIFGCLTIVRVSKPIMDEDAAVKGQKAHKIFFFVHNKEVRESFDTYRKIERLAADGFTPREYGQTVNVKKAR